MILRCTPLAFIVLTRRIGHLTEATAKTCESSLFQFQKSDKKLLHQRWLHHYCPSPVPAHYRDRKLPKSGSSYHAQHRFLHCSTSFNQNHHVNRNLLHLRERELISSIFPNPAEQPNGDQKFIDLCNSKPNGQWIYSGFDPTGPSLHVGHLAVINTLLHCYRCGHNIIIVIGGATGMIGDPSGKESDRKELDSNVVHENGIKLQNTIQRIFENYSKHFWRFDMNPNKSAADKKKTEQEHQPTFLILNNLDWYKDMLALELIGKIGRLFRLKPMLLRQSVASRLESEAGLSFTEFAYQIFQSYDWLYLFKKYGCNFQIGGHDQMGNIVAGHDLISRGVKKQVYGITVPLITSEAGNKYGKTAGDAIWLDPSKSSPFDFYQFFIRTKDTGIVKLLRMLSLEPLDKIERVLEKHKLEPEKRLAQKNLAEQLTRLIHGEEGLKLATMTSEALYAQNIQSLAQLPPGEIKEIFGNMSEIYLEPETTVLDMALAAGCFPTKKDAIRIIDAGGFSINYQKVTNFDEMIVPGVHILPNKITLARVGKKNYYVIKWSP